jgi:hypothetical protein
MTLATARPSARKYGSLVTCACSLIVTASAVLQSTDARGQDQPAKRQRPPKVEPAAPAADRAKLVVRVYPIGDLLLIEDDYPYRGGLPTSQTYGGGLGGVGGGFGGGGSSAGAGGGAGMGGGDGMVSVTDQSESASTILRQVGVGGIGRGGSGAGGGGGAATTSRRQGRSQRAAQLISAIKTCIEAEWDEEHGECIFFNNNLIVRQTEEGQTAIAHLLRALRASGGTGHSVTVEATWLVVTPQQLTTLRGPSAEGQASRFDPKAFRDLSQQATALHGQITCLNGQQVHLATGRRQVISMGGTPTVGVGAAAYTSNIAVINLGAVLQVTPSISADAPKAFVDLHSAVTQWKEPSKPPIQVTSEVLAGTAEKKIEGPAIHTMVTADRADIGTQEWSTTVSIPIGQPAYVGSVTLTDGNSGKLEPGQNPELALVIEVRQD